MVEGYLLYRKEDKTCVVLTCEDDDETIYLLQKLGRSRVKSVKELADKLIVDFYELSNGEMVEPPAHVRKSN